MEVESDDDEYVDAVHYDEIIDDDMRITNSCRPLSMYFSISLIPCESVKSRHHTLVHIFPKY